MKQEIVCQDCGQVCFQNNSGFWDCPVCDVVDPRIAELEVRLAKLERQLEAARTGEWDDLKNNLPDEFGD